MMPLGAESWPHLVLSLSSLHPLGNSGAGSRHWKIKWRDCQVRIRTKPAQTRYTDSGPRRSEPKTPTPNRKTMYTPRAFEVTDPALLHPFIEWYSFATLI